MITIKRIYDKFDSSFENRILVDRVWPRGIKRNTKKVDLWLKNIGPSNELRKWFSHDSTKWVGFKNKYIIELKANKNLSKLVRIAKIDDPIVLVYASKDIKHNNAVVLFEVLEQQLENKQKV